MGIQEMWDLFNVNDAKGLNVFEVENGIVDMTQTGDSFDSQKAINDAFNIASKAKYEKEKGLGPADNWEEQFDSIDMTNKKGEDAVLFVEFFAWAENKNMNYLGNMGVNGD